MMEGTRTAAIASNRKTRALNPSCSPIRVAGKYRKRLATSQMPIGVNPHSWQTIFEPEHRGHITRIQNWPLLAPIGQ